MINLTVADVENTGGRGWKFQTDGSQIRQLPLSLYCRKLWLYAFFYKKDEREDNGDENYIEIEFIYSAWSCVLVDVWMIIDENRYVQKLSWKGCGDFPSGEGC